MGNKYEGEEEGIIAMNDISEAARAYINHHLGNSLSSLNACLFIGDIEGSKEATEHIIADLKRVGFFQLPKEEDKISKMIYWDIQKGDDKKSGLSPKEAVKTQKRVSELLGKDMDIKQSKKGCLGIYPGKNFTITKT